MLEPGAYDDIVETIYAAAVDPKKWDDVVAVTIRAFDCVGASVFTPFVGKTQQEPIWSTNADPEFIAGYASKWGHTDPLLPVLLRRIPSPSFVYCFDDFIDRRVYEAWEGFPHMARQGARQGIGLFVSPDSHQASQLMAYTAEVDGPKVDGIKQTLMRLERRFRQAMEIHWHLAAARRKADMASMTLDMFRTGTAWLSAEGKVLYANGEMGALFGRRDGIALTNHILSFFERKADRALQAAISAAMADKSSAFQAERPSGAPAFRVNVMPLPMHAVALRLPSAAAIAFVSEAAAPTGASVEAASRIYGLTPAEARVTRHLVSGLDPQQIADQSGASINTIRTQVKSILAKAGVSRHADLIRLVATLPQVEAL
jgi:DNA-binding CsgD family transcriptional regulator